MVTCLQQLAALAAGLGFTCVERLLTVGPAGRYLEAIFKANKSLPASQVRPAVHQAATNLVGLLHVLIVVGHLASACSVHPAHISHTAPHRNCLYLVLCLLVFTGKDGGQQLNAC